jgi:transposase
MKWHFHFLMTYAHASLTFMNLTLTTPRKKLLTISASVSPSLKNSCDAGAPPATLPHCLTAAASLAHSETTSTTYNNWLTLNPTSLWLSCNFTLLTIFPFLSASQLFAGSCKVCDCAEKKSKIAAEQLRPEVQQQRQSFRERASDWLVKHLKWLDEMGIQLNLTRDYGRALPGVRVIEGVPSNYGSNYTVLATLSLSGVQAPWLLEGALDGQAFGVYISEVLAPYLEEGDILILDNLSTHKVRGIAEAVEARGARVEYLPPYSPDLNPIERCWSKLKTYLRQAKARSYEELVKGLKEGLETIRESDLQAWITFCGYPVHTLEN